jgi:hypothetical protein
VDCGNAASLDIRDQITLAAEIITWKLYSATVIDLGPEQLLNASR